MKLKKIVLISSILLATALTSCAFTDYKIDAANDLLKTNFARIGTKIHMSTSLGAKLRDIVISDNSHKVSNPAFGGKNPGEDYIVGTINFAALNMSGANFKMSDGSDYIIGVYKDNYQVLGYLENSNGKKEAYITGNYIPRLATNGLKVLNSDYNSTKQISTQPTVGLFQVGDTLKGGAVILNISRDSTKLTFSGNLEVTNGMFYLAEDESKGLIGDKNGKAIKNGDIY